MNEILLKTQCPGKIRMDKVNPIRTIGQEIARVASEEKVDFVVVRRGKKGNISSECLQHSRCTVVFTS